MTIFTIVAVLIIIFILLIMAANQKERQAEKKRLADAEIEYQKKQAEARARQGLIKEVEAMVSGTRDPYAGIIDFSISHLCKEFNELHYSVIDFETANRDRKSAISLGIAHFKGNMLLEVKEYKFKNADGGHFEFTDIRGITADDVKSLPYFDKFWPHIQQELDRRLIVAHNCAFDMEVLEALLVHFDLTLPAYRTLCTFKLAKETFDEPSFSLENLCKSKRIPYWSHRAAYDAVSAGILFMHIADRQWYKESFKRVMKGSKHIWQSAPSKPVVPKKPVKEVVSPDDLSYYALSEFITPDMFLDKNVVVTGTYYSLSRQEVEEYVLKMGAKLATGVNSKTSLLIVGDNPGPSKLQKIQELNEKIFIPVIHEVEFMEVIKVLGLIK